jgi:hypothetical protein
MLCVLGLLKEQQLDADKTLVIARSVSIQLLQLQVNSEIEFLRSAEVSLCIEGYAHLCRLLGSMYLASRFAAK